MQKWNYWLIFLRCQGTGTWHYISSSVTTRPRPFLMSSSPWRRISTIFGEDIIYSVSSIVCFWAVIFLRALMAFFIMPSSSEMMLSSRNVWPCKRRFKRCSSVSSLSFYWNKRMCQKIGTSSCVTWYWLEFSANPYQHSMNLPLVRTYLVRRVWCLSWHPSLRSICEGSRSLQPYSRRP